MNEDSRDEAPLSSEGVFGSQKVCKTVHVASRKIRSNHCRNYIHLLHLPGTVHIFQKAYKQLRVLVVGAPALDSTEVNMPTVTYGIDQKKIEL